MKKISTFKLVIIIFSISFLGILFRYSQILDEYAKNGRYYYSSEDSIIIDTRTGEIYYLKSTYENEGFEKVNDALSK